MRSMKSHSGSALLVVLGMVAFMIVSAVSFSAYMRNSRLPSSYLRRTVYSRQLVKAALARAIDDVDRSVANNPHPGIGNENNLNYWAGRVLSGGNEEVKDLKNADTVSVLTLEGLAYIPPPLVNYVRYYSRIVETAKWQSFNFDAGRYAFCAIDVSDYFDVNRMTAGEPRSSAANTRVSLSYLFENSQHTSSSGTNAKKWDEWMKKFRDVDENTGEISYGSKVPLVSMADFNLALGANGDIGNMRSPFYRYIMGTDEMMLGGQSDHSQSYSRMPFVTDSLFLNSTTNAVSGKSCDIADGANQPFSAEYMQQKNPNLGEFVFAENLQANDRMHWDKYLTGLGCAALYDYLDPDHIPVSLAAPTVERTPMICGINLDLVNAKFTITKEVGQEQYSDESGNTRTATRIVNYNISPATWEFLNGRVQTLAMFPFAHEDEEDGKFKLDGRLSVFFTEGQTSLRSGHGDDPYHLTKKEIDNSGVNENAGIVNIKLEAKDFSMPSFPIKSEENAFKSVSLSTGDGQLAAESFFAGTGLLRVTYQWQQTKASNTGGVGTQGAWGPKFEDVEKQVLDGAGAEGRLSGTAGAHHCSLPATIWNNGRYTGVDTDLSDDSKIRNIVAGEGKEVTLRTALWLRVVDTKNNNTTVDMVPACIRDDKDQGLVGNFDDMLEAVGLGEPYPIMMFDAGVKFKLSLKGLEDLINDPPEIKIAKQRLVVADPRYNFAPEHWYSLDGTTPIDANAWLTELDKSMGTDRDDIFMMTSDAGYLQSPCEIAMLPRLTDLVSRKGDLGLFLTPSGKSYLNGFPQSFSDTQNNALAWSTYDIFGDDRTAFNNLPWTNSGKGMKVNPYSDSTNILMAVFANTPIDWKRASTNDVDGASECAFDFAGDVDGFNKEYAYNQYSKYKLNWDDLTAIAGEFSKQVRSRNGDWKSAFDNLGWYYDEDSFCGVTLKQNAAKSLWSVDRKYLYGYWRDCFAAEQQLFLIFVRAEPVMMGSGMMGKIPPQLGGRAVALVWRDPTAVQNTAQGGITGYPHKTRVLFYRHLD